MKVAVYYCDICGEKTDDSPVNAARFDYGDSDPCWGGTDEERELLHVDDNYNYETYNENLRILSNPDVLICWNCSIEGNLFDEAFTRVRKIRTKILLEIRKENGE